MGQYWRAVVIGEDVEEIVKPEDFNDGRKLTEHSWILNNFVGEVCSMIHNNPCRVAWIGDYAEHDLMEWVWPEKGIPKVEKVSSFDPNTLIEDDSYLINHTTQEYIKLNEYYERCQKARPNEWGVMHPLSLLTAIGNGQGGGDYRGENEKRVGMWAMHELELVYGNRFPKSVDPSYYDMTEKIMFYE